MQDCKKPDKENVIELSEDAVRRAYDTMKSIKSKDVLDYMQRMAAHKNWLQRSVCPICGQSVIGGTLKDSLSWKEFCISGMCQNCQDNIFRDPDDDKKQDSSSDSD